MADPTLSSPYVTGTISITGGAAVSLFALIVSQLDPDVSSMAQRVNLQAPGDNGGTIAVGCSNRATNTDVSATNRGYDLAPGANVRYDSTGSEIQNVPLGRMRVFCATDVKLNVEVIA